MESEPKQRHDMNTVLSKWKTMHRQAIPKRTRFGSEEKNADAVSFRPVAEPIFPGKVFFRGGFGRIF